MLVFLANVLTATKNARYRLCILFALSMALFSICAWPQTQLAAVFGTVTDPSGAVIPGAQVTMVITAAPTRCASEPSGILSYRAEPQFMPGTCPRILV